MTIAYAPNQTKRPSRQEGSGNPHRSTTACGVVDSGTPVALAGRPMVTSSAMRGRAPDLNLPSRWLPLGYTFRVLTSPLLPARDRAKTNCPARHLRAGLVLGEYSEWLRRHCRVASVFR